jgi:PIN domain nuclease of toxin-antitoxin system
MSAWEIGMLSAKGRLRIPLSPLDWFQRLLRSPGIAVADITISALIASSLLPGFPPRDPVDRILLATAVKGITVL